MPRRTQYASGVVLLINTDDRAYPHYHQSSDTIDQIDFNLMHSVAKTVTSAAALHAAPARVSGGGLLCEEISALGELLLQVFEVLVAVVGLEVLVRCFQLFLQLQLLLARLRRAQNPDRLGHVERDALLHAVAYERHRQLDGAWEAQGQLLALRGLLGGAV